MAFSPDGRTLGLLPALDPSIRLWDVGSQQQLGSRFTTRPSARPWLSAATDARWPSAVTGTIRLWDRILWRNDAELRERGVPARRDAT